MQEKEITQSNIKIIPPMQNNHQGEQNDEKYEDVRTKDINFFSNIPFKNSEISPSKFDLNKILSQASKQELITPTKKDMSIREYIKNFNTKSQNIAVNTNNETCKSLKPLSSRLYQLQ